MQVMQSAVYVHLSTCSTAKLLAASCAFIAHYKTWMPGHYNVDCLMASVLGCTQSCTALPARHFTVHRCAGRPCHTEHDEPHHSIAAACCNTDDWLCPDNICPQEHLLAKETGAAVLPCTRPSSINPTNPNSSMVCSCTVSLTGHCNIAIFYAGTLADLQYSAVLNESTHQTVA